MAPLAMFDNILLIPFPVKLVFSMTATNAQGQALDEVGIYIASEFFSHGQLCVAISRVGDMDCVKILFKEEDKFHVKNVVYKEVLLNSN